MTLQTAPTTALDRARRKAYLGLLPILFFSYMIAYIDRVNVGLAKLSMTKDLLGFDDKVIGFGAGICFFVGYFLLEIPGTLICERWSARKWIFRIMVTWGIIAACTALVKTPKQFYLLRFLLGLAEAGFFPGVIVYLSHWFTKRDRGRALAYFFVATPIAQLLSPKISGFLLDLGTPGHPSPWGLWGWQWLFIFWGIPAVVLGFIVVVILPDHPRDARWLNDEEKRSLENELEAERMRTHGAGGRRMHLLQALGHPKVLLLTLAYFCTTSANYGLDIFMPTILKDWYNLSIKDVTSAVLLPPLVALFAQLFVGWNSDRTRERRLHAVVCILVGAVALALVPQTFGHLWLTVLGFTLLSAGIKGLQPAFWALPNIFLTEVAAAGSIGFINSVGNLGGGVGPYALGAIKEHTHSFMPGIYLLAGMMFLAAAILFWLGLGRKETDQSDSLSSVLRGEGGGEG